jgi:mRNA-degrading endonuclease RelE of RelBE toxin-antitoxin system
LAVDTLANFPECKNVKRLVNHPHEYRLRVGRYRVFFDVRTRVQIITIEEVKKRDEKTY